MSLMEQKRNETPLEEARRKWGAQRVEAGGLRKVERQGARGVPRERGRSEPRTSIGNPERSLPPGGIRHLSAPGAKLWLLSNLQAA